MAIKFIKPKRKRFKSDKNWLKALYNKNKEIIDYFTTPDPQGKLTKKQQFFNLIKEIQKDKYYQNKYRTGKVTAVRAVKELLNTEVYTPKSERLTKNFLSSFKKNTDLYESFRNEIGIFSSLKPDKFHWDKEEQAYIYDVYENGVLLYSYAIGVKNDDSPPEWYYQKIKARKRR